MIEILQEIYDEYQMYHSSYQVENFIIGNSSCVNTYARYKQAEREVFSRYKSIKEAYLNIIEFELDREDTLSELTNQKNGSNSTEAKRLKLKLYRTESNLEDAYKSLKEVKREFTQMVNILLTYREFIKNKDREDLERELWMDAVRESAVKDLQLTGTVTPKTFDFAMSMHPNDRAQLVPMLKNSEQLLQWFNTKENIIKQIEIKECPEESEKMITDAKRDIPGIEYVSNI